MWNRPTFRGRLRGRAKKEEPRDGSLHQRRKASANLRRIYAVLFDISPRTAQVFSRLSSPPDSPKEEHLNGDNSFAGVCVSVDNSELEDDEYEQLDFFPVKKQTVATSSLQKEEAFSGDDGHEKMDVSHVKNQTRSRAKLLASRGGKFLKEFKRKASNLSSRSSSPGNSFVDEVEVEASRPSMCEKTLDWAGGRFSVDQLQEELQILRQRLAKGEDEMQKLRHEVCSLRSATTSLQQSGPPASSDISRNNGCSALDGTRPSLDFFPTSMLSLEEQHRSRVTAASSEKENKMRQDYMDSFLADAAAALPDGGLTKASQDAALRLMDVGVSKRHLHGEFLENYRDEDGDLKFMESEIPPTNSKHLPARNTELDMLFNSGEGLSGPTDLLRASRSPPDSSLEDNMVLPAIPATTSDSTSETSRVLRSSSSDATVSVPTSPSGSWSLGVVADIDTALVETGRAAKLRFVELEEKLLKSLNSFEGRRKELPRSNATPDHRIVLPSLPKAESDSTLEEAPLAVTGNTSQEVDSKSSEASKPRPDDRKTLQPQQFSEEKVILELPLTVRERLISHSQPKTPPSIAIESLRNSRVDIRNSEIGSSYGRLTTPHTKPSVRMPGSLLQASPRSPKGNTRLISVESQLQELSLQPLSGTSLWPGLHPRSPREDSSSVEDVVVQEDANFLQYNELGREVTNINKHGINYTNDQQNLSGKLSREACISVLAVSRRRRSLGERGIPVASSDQVQEPAGSLSDSESNVESSGAVERDYGTITPQRLREAVYSWDKKKRSDLEPSSPFSDTQTPRGRPSRFSREANVSFASTEVGT